MEDFQTSLDSSRLKSSQQMLTKENNFRIKAGNLARMSAFTFIGDINETGGWFIHQPQKQSPCFIFNGLTQAVWHYRSKTELVLPSWLNRCSITKQKRFRRHLRAPLDTCCISSGGALLFVSGRLLHAVRDQSEHFSLNVTATRERTHTAVVA